MLLFGVVGCFKIFSICDSKVGPCIFKVILKMNPLVYKCVIRKHLNFVFDLVVIKHHIRWMCTAVLQVGGWMNVMGLYISGWDEV